MPVAREAHDAIVHRLLVAESRLAALRDALRDVIATIPSEFASAEVQAVRRHARALLVEVGR